MDGDAESFVDHKILSPEFRRSPISNLKRLFLIDGSAAAHTAIQDNHVIGRHLAIGVVCIGKVTGIDLPYVDAKQGDAQFTGIEDARIRPYILLLQE